MGVLFLLQELDCFHLMKITKKTRIKRENTYRPISMHCLVQNCVQSFVCGAMMPLLQFDDG